MDGGVDEGIGKDCQALSPRTEREGPNSPHAASPGTPLYARREGRDTHTHAYIHAHIAHTHVYINTHSLSHTHTNPTRLKWARHFDIDLFFLSLPHPPIFSSLTPHPLLDSPLALHRAILLASAEEEGRGGKGRGRTVGAYLERGRGAGGGRVGGKEEEEQ